MRNTTLTMEVVECTLCRSNDEQVCMACYLIVGKVMRKYTKGECTLDAITVAEFNKNGTPMNWCKYLLTEMFQEACADVHE
jgi:hypothetical protein